MLFTFQWDSVSSFEASRLNEAQNQLHYAVQFIALAGKYLTATAEDDSHTNMAWNHQLSQFEGRVIDDKIKIVVHLPSFSLRIVSEDDHLLCTLELNKKPFQEVFDWMKERLPDFDVDTSLLERTMHFELPDHPVGHVSPFQMPDDELLNQLALHRSNSQRLLESVASPFEQASEIRTWPHHFDHGISIPLELDSTGAVLRSFSVGYAIHDTLVDEPYVYVTQRKKDEVISYDDAPELAFGQWLPEKLQGAVLPFSELTTVDYQQEKIVRFIDQTTEWWMETA
ncbi:MAG: hypothetical protein AAFW89_09730 [Bacteroidota bacterium]